jgi:hypothetical protein
MGKSSRPQPEVQTEPSAEDANLNAAGDETPRPAQELLEQAGMPVPDIQSPSGQSDDAAPPKPAPAASERIRVEVICNGFLGPKLLRKGDITDDPAYVKLIGDPRRLVRPV